jgi:Succinate dehydrogenase/fumarate reductase, flavoprotein subunit
MADDMRTETADVIVVGGGGAGLTAAIFARVAGARVVLLEKNDRLGGATQLCVGTYTASGTRLQKACGIADSVELHMQDMLRVVGRQAESEPPGLRRAMAEEAAELLDWLTSLGMTFYGPVLEKPNSAARMHTILPNADAFIYFLEREARRVGVHIRLGASVTRLQTTDGRVTGVEVGTAGRSRSFQARSVILTTGDFSASPEWRGRFAPEMTGIDGLAPTSTGDGHRMGEALGATIRDEIFFYGPNLRFTPPPAKGLLSRLPPYRLFTRLMAWALDTLPPAVLRPFMMSFVTTYLSPEPSLFENGAILVNRNGERFAEELEGPNLALAAQPDKLGYIVFDDALARKFNRFPFFVSTAPGVAYAYFDDYRRYRPDIYHRGESIAALAQSIGVPPENLARTITERNAALGSGPGPKPPGISAGPFHALGPVQSWIVLTDGSLTTDLSQRVLRSDGSPIEGLFAAGAVGQGGIVLPGHGTHLAWAFVSGRRAGIEAAKATGDDTGRHRPPLPRDGGHDR